MLQRFFILAILATPAMVTAQESATGSAAEPAVLSIPLPADPAEVNQFRRAIAGDNAVGFASQSRIELEIVVAPMPLAELESRVTAALDYLQTVATGLSKVLLEGERLSRKGAIDKTLEEEFSQRVQLIFEFRDKLAAHALILIDAAEAKGADLSEARAYVDVVNDVRLPDEDADTDLDADERAARMVIRRVREDPPVHERPMPWTVSVTELVEGLQPLRREELEERVEAWLKILQGEVRQRIRIDIALGKTDAQQEKDLIAKLSSEQQEVVNETVDRLQAVLEVLAKRGGDTSVARQYISNATGQQIDLRDPAVFFAQAKAWALSPSGGLRLALHLGKFLLILLVVWLVSSLVGRIVSAAVRRLPKSSSLLHDFLVGLSRRVIMLIGFLIAVSALGINITPLAAAIGAAGLVIGLALQGTLSNFASGILILIYRPFDVGDVINAGGVFGKVDTMTLVSTRILTFDNQVNWVPNDSIWNNVITNATALQTRRVDMVFGIGYSDDIATAQAIIEDVVGSHPKVLPDPAPTIRVNELGDNSVNFVVRPWAETGDYWDVYWDTMRTLKERFDAAGINIPFPQRDVHLSGPIEVMVTGSKTAGHADADTGDAVSARPLQSALASTSSDEPGPAPADNESAPADKGDDMQS